jgi:hypothetical protein
MLSTSTFRRLADTDTAGLRVSLYMPTHRVGRGVTAQDPLRLKNLLAQAAVELETLGARPSRIDVILGPGRALLADVEFWEHQADGLAVFLADGEVDAFRLPQAFDELAVVGDRFHLKPLLPLLSGDGRFAVLALSQERVQLYEGSRGSLRAIDVLDLPRNLRDVVGYDWEDSSLQFHTGGSSRPGGMRAAMFHGDGSPKDDAKPEIASFLRAIDDGVARILGPDDLPVVLAGVGFEASMFRQVTKLPHVMAEVIEGSPDRVPLEALHARAWEVVAPRFLADRDASAERVRALESTDQATTDLATTLAAADEGRIDTVFVAVDRAAWSRPDGSGGDAETHPERRPGDRDLLDAAAVRALLTGAHVYAVDQERMPVADTPIAAILRY